MAIGAPKKVRHSAGRGQSRRGFVGKELRRWPLRLALGTILGILTVGGTAYATDALRAGGKSAVIRACRSKVSGVLRVVANNRTGCRSEEAAITWNVQGVKGDPGLTGAAG